MIAGKVITFEEFGQFPQRAAFLDRAAVTACQTAIKNAAPTLFLPIDIYETWLPEDPFNMTKYSKRLYKIVMFGILKSGEKITVVIDDIFPYFEIRVPRGEDPDKFMEATKRGAASQNFKVCNFEIVQGATIREYDDRASFIKLSFRGTAERSKCIKWFDADTTHDDISCYYRVASRDHAINLASWIVITRYRSTRTHPFFATRTTITTSFAGMRNFAGDIFADPALKNDMTIEANFDIETYEAREGVSDVPMPASATADMFKISLCFTTIDAAVYPASGVDPGDPTYDFDMPPGHLIHYDITTAVTQPMPNRVVVQCRNHTEMITAFAIIWSQMQPDYAVGFNNDNYDWLWIAERARQLGLLEVLESKMSLARLSQWEAFDDRPRTEHKSPFHTGTVEGRTWGYAYWKKYQFKISVDVQQFTGAALSYPGYVCIDLMPQLRAMNNNPEKYSLRVFLDQYKLGDKVDMPYKEMFRLYAENKRMVMALDPLKDMRWSTIEEAARANNSWDELFQNAMQMRRVAEYCVVDSLRCHDLLAKTSFIRDKREVGVLSFTTMDDCVKRANGMKVRNMIIGAAHARNLHVSNIPPKIPEQGKYPGAYVFPPKKGVASAKPSPTELRARGDPEWRGMPDPEFKNALQLIAAHGIHAEDYPTDIELNATLRDWLARDTHYPIAGLDFSSLYPSLIMAYNLSPEMMVHTLVRAMELATEGKSIHAIQFKFGARDIRGWSVRHSYAASQVEIDATLRALAGLAKHEETREAELLRELERLLVNAEFGLFPSVLKMLFDKRLSLKAELKPLTRRKEEIENMPEAEFAAQAKEYKDLMFKWNYLNSKQKALKVFMNTFYGECGNANSPLRVLAMAGGITVAGQYNIKMVKDLVEADGCRVYYGDSVTEDTPVILRQDNTIKGVKFRTFIDISRWHTLSDGKQISQEWNNEQIWTAAGWAAVESVVRHRTNKRIFRVSTPHGSVDATEDHSLMTSDMQTISPDKCCIGTPLLHHYPVANCSPFSIAEDTPTTADECRAFVYGVFFGIGRCGMYQSPWGLPITSDVVLRAATTAYPDVEFARDERIINTLDPRLYQEYRPAFYPDDYTKQVPDSIINGALEIKSRFIQGYRASGSRGGRSNIAAAGYYYVMRSLGHIQFDQTMASVDNIQDRGSTQEYVYDITTANGTFQAGVGEIIVHNTDSIYISMPRTRFAQYDRDYYSDKITKQDYFEKLVMASFDAIKIVNRKVNETLESDNGTKFLAMAFEEFLFPAAFFSKKKYCGIAHLGEFNANPKEIFVKGLEYVKKGTSPMLRDISVDILWRTFAVDNIATIFEIVEKKISEVYRDPKAIEFDKFIKTATYKPNKQNVSVHTFHRRMKVIGCAPDAGDRFRYVIVKRCPYTFDVAGRKSDLSIGDQMEYAHRAEEYKMEINLDYYMSKNVCGQLARFVSYDPRFDVAAKDDSDDSYNEAEKKNIDMAKKYILTLYTQWSTTSYVSKGPALKTLFKKVNCAFHDRFASLLPTSNLWKLDADMDKTYAQIVDKIAKITKTESKKDAQKIIDNLRCRKLEEWVEKKNAYTSLVADRRRQITVQRAPLLAALRKEIATLTKLFTKRNVILEDIVTELKAELDIDAEELETCVARVDAIASTALTARVTKKIDALITNLDLKALAEIDAIYIKLIAVSKLFETTVIVEANLKLCVHSKLGNNAAVREIDHTAGIDEFMRDNL